MSVQQTYSSRLTCLVCGDIARGCNFNVITCMSCKTFFRRHALKTKLNFVCQHYNNCEITAMTRSFCGSCRLKKCFSLGMDETLIKSYTDNIDNSKRHRWCIFRSNNEIRLPKPLPLNLLRYDNSLLTSKEWILLSNVVHGYDATNLISRTRQLLDRSSSLPPKLRSKQSEAVIVVKEFYSTIQQIMERSADFHNLSVDTRRCLIENNTEILGAFNGLFIAREINALDNMIFVAHSSAFYGFSVIKEFSYFIGRLEPNGILLKIMILTMGFSACCAIVDDFASKPRKSSIIPTSVIHVQNKLVDMLWKYLIYLYGFAGAVHHFDALVKFVVDLLCHGCVYKNAQHEKVMDMLVEESILQ